MLPSSSPPFFSAIHLVWNFGHCTTALQCQFPVQFNLHCPKLHWRCRMGSGPHNIMSSHGLALRSHQVASGQSTHILSGTRGPLIRFERFFSDCFLLHCYDHGQNPDSQRLILPILSFIGHRFVIIQFMVILLEYHDDYSGSQYFLTTTSPDHLHGNVIQVVHSLLHCRVVTGSCLSRNWSWKALFVNLHKLLPPWTRFDR